MGVLLGFTQDRLHLDTFEFAQPAGQGAQGIGGALDDETDHVEVPAIAVPVVEGHSLTGQDEVVEIAHHAVELLGAVAVLDDEGDDA